MPRTGSLSQARSYAHNGIGGITPYAVEANRKLDILA